MKQAISLQLAPNAIKIGTMNTKWVDLLKSRPVSNWNNPEPFDLDAIFEAERLKEEEWAGIHNPPTIFCTEAQLPGLRKLFGIPEPGVLSKRDETLIERIYGKQ